MFAHGDYRRIRLSTQPIHEQLQTDSRQFKDARAKFGEILQIYKSLIDDFLDPAKREYAYDKKQICRKSHNTEKDRQQQLYAAYFLNDVPTYYDIEYTEHNSAANNVPGRFDLLGLRKENGAYTLLLTELKSTLNACDGKSGIAKHESDYTKYLDSSFIETRKAEASSAENLPIRHYPTVKSIRRTTVGSKRKSYRRMVWKQRTELQGGQSPPFTFNLLYVKLEIENIKKVLKK